MQNTEFLNVIAEYTNHRTVTVDMEGDEYKEFNFSCGEFDAETYGLCVCGYIQTTHEEATIGDSSLANGTKTYTEVVDEEVIITGIYLIDEDYMRYGITEKQEETLCELIASKIKPE